MAKKRGRKRGRRKDPFKLSLKKETVYSVSSTLLFVLAGLILLSFARTGSLLIALNQFLVDYFGWVIVIIPFWLITMGLMLTRLKIWIGRPNVVLGTFLAILGFSGLFHSGKIGFYLFTTAAASITGFGAGIIFLGIIFISFVIMFETSLEEVLLFLHNVGKWFSSMGFSFRKKPAFLPPKEKQLKIIGDTQVKPDELPAKAKKDDEKDKDKSITLTGTTNVPGQVSKIWRAPPLSLLSDEVGGKADRGNLKENADTIEKTLESFGVSARVAEVNCGPAVTQYALEISLGTKLSKITALSNDLALALAAPTGQIRIEAPIPGRSMVGVEIPNKSLEFVTLKEMLTSSAMKKSKSKLDVGLGLDVAAKPILADIGSMPHVLIAGATGSGKSVAINSFIASILFRTTPEEVKLILVDPKRVELTQYNGIPHLLTPVIVEPEKVVSALKWSINEMEHRYKMFAENGVRNIAAYNQSVGFQAMPYIVIVVDELADIMLFAPSEVEDSITRIAQMARATGIHLVVATQRPSVDVITGLIKANIPCRIAFNVSSMVDSRVIIDTPGAEKLLGRGDMLYIPPNQSKPSRIQGTYVSDVEIQALINYLKKTGIDPQYTEEVTDKYKGTVKKGGKVIPGESKQTDELFENAVRMACQYDRASASLLQRKLSIGYARAARILDQLYEAGLVSAAEGSKPREVLVKNADDFLARLAAEE
jgi:S-DNA-T family DNA segregation ATPase FtsK/SpoIIIE